MEKEATPEPLVVVNVVCQVYKVRFQGLLDVMEQHGKEITEGIDGVFWNAL